MTTENFSSVSNENSTLAHKRTFMFNTRNITDTTTALGNLYVDYYVVFKGITALEPEFGFS
jgi:hypothetical protein